MQVGNSKGLMEREDSQTQPGAGCGFCTVQNMILCTSTACGAAMTAALWAHCSHVNRQVSAKVTPANSLDVEVWCWVQLDFSFLFYFKAFSQESKA